MSDKEKVFHALLGAKIDPFSEIKNSGLLTTGSVLVVKDPSDVDYLVVKDAVGRDNFFDDPQAALDKTRSDMNDYVLVAPKDANGIWDLGTALDIVNDRVHLISLGHTNALHGYSNTIRGFGSAALDSEVVNVTGNGVEVAGFRFLGTHGTTADGTIDNVLNVTGSQFNIHHSVVESNVAAGASDGTLVNVGANGFAANHSWFGNTSGNQAAISVTGATTRHLFENCTFVMDAEAVGDEFFLSAAGAGQYSIVRDSAFINLELGTLVASAITGSVAVDNPWLFMNNSYVNITDAGSDPTVFVSPSASGTIPKAYNPGHAIGTLLIRPA